MTTLPGGLLLVVGGVSEVTTDLDFGASVVPLRTEVLVPSFLCPESLRATGCVAGVAAGGSQ